MKMSMEQFVVKSEPLIPMKSSVEHIFDVTIEIEFLLKPQEFNSNPSNMQWIILKGNPNSIKFAKEFIMGLCSPEKHIYMPCPQQLHKILSCTKWQHILQRNTRAVIKLKPDNFIYIFGTALNALLAQSVFEQLIHSYQSVSYGYQSAFDFDSHLESEFLAMLLEFDIDFCDYESIPKETKRILLEWVREYKNLDQDHKYIDHILNSDFETEERSCDSDEVVILDIKSPQLNTNSQKNVRKRKRRKKKCAPQTSLINAKENKDDKRHIVYEIDVSPVAKKQDVYGLKDLIKDFNKNTTSLTLEDTKPKNDLKDTLRPIVIDGSNIALTHGNKKIFSCQGIRICVNYFKDRGHKNITVFVPNWRKSRPKSNSPILDQYILHELEDEDVLKFTPSRVFQGINIASYEDRFIVQLATTNGGVVVSNDNFRDIMEENRDWKETIKNRLLMYTFVGDVFMVPEDPLGRKGPILSDFLKFPSLPKTKSDVVKTVNNWGQSDVIKTVNNLGRSDVNKTVKNLGRSDVIKTVNNLGRSDVIKTVNNLGRSDVIKTINNLEQSDVIKTVNNWGQFSTHLFLNRPSTSSHTLEYE